MCIFFNDTATTEIYTLSLHDALPISTTRTSGRSSAPPTTSTIMLSSFVRSGSWGWPRPEARPELARDEEDGVLPLHVPGEAAEVRVPLLEERVPPLDGLLGHVGQPRRLAGE